jgi:Mn-dependent DtxR family transcriptional regulator
MDNSLKLTKSVEDYLEVMYNLEKEKGVIKIKDIASEMNVNLQVLSKLLKNLLNGILSFKNLIKIFD